MKKLESLNQNLFKNFEKAQISNLGQILGGKKTKSSSTGWTCKDDSNGHDAGPWEPKAAVAVPGVNNAGV